MRMWLGIAAFVVMIGLSWLWNGAEPGTDALAQPVAASFGEQPTSPATLGGNQTTGGKAEAWQRAAIDPLVPAMLVIRPDGVSPTAPFPGGGWLKVYDPRLPDDDFSSDDRASFHPHGQKFCSSGCTVSNHPTRELTEPLFRQLVAEYAQQPMDETSPALESLVYYGRQARQLLESEGTEPLDPVRAAVLRRELSRTHARISIRVVDEGGVVRASLPPTRVPLDRRHVFRMETNDVQPLVTSGTVKRVGMHHLWNRL